MSRPNFRESAVEFVRKHNCACHTPVELIEAAMQDGYAMAIDYTKELVKKANDDLRELRRKSQS